MTGLQARARPSLVIIKIKIKMPTLSAISNCHRTQYNDEYTDGLMALASLGSTPDFLCFFKTEMDDVLTTL